MRARTTAAVFVLLASARAAADAPAPIPPKVYIQTDEPRLICVPAIPIEHCRDLPPGRFLDEPHWQIRDAETKRLQDAETRLTAENKSLRTTAETWQPGWKTLLLAVGTGIGLGWYAFH